MIVLAREFSDSQLGDAIVASLGLSRREDLSDRAFMNAIAPTLREAHARTIDDLSREWGYIRVADAGEQLSVAPMRRCVRGGYMSLQGDPIFQSPKDPQKIGACVRLAIASSNLHPCDEDESVDHT